MDHRLGKVVEFERRQKAAKVASRVQPERCNSVFGAHGRIRVHFWGFALSMRAREVTRGFFAKRLSTAA
jgi:hypothetical protein